MPSDRHGRRGHQSAIYRDTCRFMGCNRPTTLGSRYCGRHKSSVIKPPRDDLDPKKELDWILDKRKGDDFPERKTMTPASVTRITLNPKVDGEPTDLRCPVCEEPIRAASGHDGGVVEYRCGCDELRKFRVRGEDDD